MCIVSCWAKVMVSESILVIKHGALGDIILATGHMKAIRDHHPTAHITCLTTKAYVNLLSACPFVDDVWCDDKPRLFPPRGWKKLKSLLRSKPFTWVYDLQTSSRSTSYWWLFGTPKPQWSGIALMGSHPQKGAYRHRLHATEQLNDQLRIAGITTQGKPEIQWLDASIDELNMPKTYALLVPGGAPHRPDKRWPAAHYVDIARHLLEHHITPVIIGTAAEEGVIASIMDAVPECHNLCARTSIAQLAALARKAQWAVGNDTGPMHIIAAAGGAFGGAVLTCIQPRKIFPQRPRCYLHTASCAFRTFSRHRVGCTSCQSWQGA